MTIWTNGSTSGPADTARAGAASASPAARAEPHPARRAAAGPNRRGAEAAVCTERSLQALAARAGRLAPIAARALAGPLPGAGVSPAAGRLARTLLRAGEAEAAQFEAACFGAGAAETEVAGHETAHEAALTEVLAAEAAHTASESEAAALIGATLPITIHIMGGRRALRPLLPALARANARLARTLHRQGLAGRQLLRLTPTIQRRTVGSLRAGQRLGRRLTPGLAVRVMAAQTQRVLSEPRLLGCGIVRNTTIRGNTVAPTGQRAGPRRTAG